MPALVGASALQAEESQNTAQLEYVEVTGRRINLVGEAVSASQGLVGQQEIAIRPLLRTGEILEMVPGMVVTQHSGTGKANQYFLRGFNLDHGTDFATFVDAMPVNMRSHGHGQGYTDLNLIIPEAIKSIAYKKGPYYADVGDVSGAGSASISTANRVDQGTLEVTVGEDDYYRLLVLDGVVRSDSVGELSAGLYWENQLSWTEQLKTVLGLRYDYYDFDVDGRVAGILDGAAYYRFTDNWTFDLEYAYTEAQFVDSAPEGDAIPGAVENVWQVGLSADYANGLFGSLRLRYFGERPLDESATVMSDSSTNMNLRVAYRWDNWIVKADVLNLLDSSDHDIDYLYSSRLPNESSGVATEDIHYHLFEPRTVRVSVNYRF